MANETSRDEAPEQRGEDRQSTAEEMARKLGLPYADEEMLRSARPLEEFLNIEFMRRYGIFPLHRSENRMHVAMANPVDSATVDAVRMFTGCEVEPAIGSEEMIAEAIERVYGAGATTVKKIIENLDDSDMEIFSEPDEEDESHLRDLAFEAPVVRLVNLLVTRAVEAGASDIHFEPFEEKLVVRYRIDGVLQEVDSPPRGLQAAIISRLKLMAKMNIAERRLPQDGRVKVKVESRSIDIRVSTVPTVFGESLVMRLLDKEKGLISLESLGFSTAERERFEKLILRPHGMILVTGPTGSGKTTTLYSVLMKLLSTEKKIIAIEDPVEYQVTGVNQIQVKPKIGLTFASGLRSIVRQDPDIIMVGEIRDRETADIAVHAALTGHLVLSTVHTNDAAGALTRLADMGLERYLIASSVVGILAQRLVRRVCSECSVPTTIDRVLVEQFEGGGLSEGGSFRSASGCTSCAGTGYRGRTGIFELMPMSETLKDLTLRGTAAGSIREMAVREGMTTLRRDGIEKAKDGVTTFDEILRSTEESG